MPSNKLPATTRPSNRSAAGLPPGHDDRDLFSERLRERRDQLSGAMLRALRFIDQNRIVALASSAAELARRTRTSDATVIRAVQTLGFSGLPELRQALTTSLQAGRAPPEGMPPTLPEARPSADPPIPSRAATHYTGFRPLPHRPT